MDQFGAVTLERLAAGELAKKLNAQIAATTQKLAEYVTEGGVDRTEKAKAEVTLKLTFVHVGAGAFTVKGDVTSKAPTTPLPSINRLVLEDGELLIPLADTLNSNDDPRQRELPLVGAGSGSSNPQKKDL